MSDKAIDQMISAYATGSLDRENFIQFRNYMKKGGNLPKGELGEQQNVMSLIPVILDLEKPEKRIKALVVTKIIDIQEKLKTTGTAGPERVTEEQPIPAEEPVPSIPAEIPAREVRRKSLHDTEGPRTTAAGPATTKERILQSTPGSVLPWIIVFFMLIALIIATFYFTQLTSDLEEQVAEIRDQLVGFQTEIARTNEFVNDHLDLVEFFNYNDVRIVNLLPMNEKSDASGRLLLSFKSGEGLLQLKNMPDLDNSEVYQVWMVSKDVTFPLAAIKTSPEVKYYKISNIPYLPARDIQLFRVTKESGPEINVPEGTAYLYGIFLKDTGRRR